MTIAVLLLALACGCATESKPDTRGMRFSEYTGSDASSAVGTWSTSQGSMAETAYVIPVYRGWPERHYRVLGSLSHPDQNAYWGEGEIERAAKAAKSLGGDAIVIRKGAEYGVSQIAGTRQQSTILSSPHVTTALVVRWLTADELQERERILEECLKAFSANHPSMQSQNRGVGELALILILQSGFDLNSGSLRERFVEQMAQLIGLSADNLSGKWVFKASMSASTLASGGSERNFLGTAVVSADQDNVAIVSDTGRIELNFSGTLTHGRLGGQIGLGGVTSKCEGAVTPEKISLSFQSRSPDGTTQGNVTLQRILLSNPTTNEKIDPASSPSA